MSSCSPSGNAPVAAAQSPGQQTPADPRAVRVVKINHEGRRVFSYEGEVVFRSEGMVVAHCIFTLPRVVDVGLFAITQGDIFMEHYYANEWFNIFTVYDRSGTLKGWYCNIAEPTQVCDGEIGWRDWALDLVVAPDRRQLVADEDEFEALNPSPEIRAQAKAGLATLQRWATESHPPFFHL